MPPACTGSCNPKICAQWKQPLRTFSFPWGRTPPRRKVFSVHQYITNRVTAKVNSRGRRGHAPALRKVHPLLPQLLSRGEPGAPPKAVVYCQGNRLELSAATGRPPPCLSLWERCPVRTLGGEGFPLSKSLSCNEPGDPLRCWLTTRVSGSPLTAAARRPPILSKIFY